MTENESYGSKTRAMTVLPSTLLAIAGAFWTIAGANVAAVGMLACFESINGILAGISILIGALIVFFLFFFKIFRPYAAKHETRIKAMGQERVSPLRFMDKKGYIMIAFMIALGAGLRLSGLVPSWFIAFFYVGLGTALALTGVLFLIAWSRRNQ